MVRSIHIDIYTRTSTQINIPMHILQQLGTPPVVPWVPIGRPPPVRPFHLVVLHRPHQNKMQLQGKMQRMLADDQHKLFQCGGGPVDFEVDDHVCELGDVEFDAFKDGFLVRVFTQHIGQFRDDLGLEPVLPDDDGRFAHVYGIVGREEFLEGAVVLVCVCICVCMCVGICKSECECSS